MTRGRSPGPRPTTVKGAPKHTPQLLLAGVLAATVLVLGQCAGRPTPLEDQAGNSRLVVAVPEPIRTWPQFFACNPFRDDAMARAILRANGYSLEKTNLPRSVVIPLDPGVGGEARDESRWMLSQLLHGAQCPLDGPSA